MATSYSTNLALALPATGELSGTWGTTVNANITNMLDEALGYQAFSATGGSDTLTIPDGTTGVARSIYIQLNGTGGGTVNVPTAKTKMYFVFNNTASAITFKVTGQTGVSIPAAAKMALVSNGTDIIVAQNYFAALTLGAALPVASGGTGTATPSIVAGTNVTVSGTWPNQTVAVVSPVTVVRSARTANTILGTADVSTLIDITSGTFSQTFTAAATLGSGWFCYIRNSGTGVITLDPNASEQIDGLTSYVMYTGECRLVQCTGTAFFSVVLSPFNATFTTTSTFIQPPGYTSIYCALWGGGGGGGGAEGRAAGNHRYGGGAGGGGARNFLTIAAPAPGTSITATVGAGGAGGAGGTNAVGVVGIDGGTTSFGSYVYAYGGAYGNAGSGGGGSGGGGGGAAGAGSGSTGGLPRMVVYFEASEKQFGSAVNEQANNIGFGGGGGRNSTVNNPRGFGSTEYGGSGGGLGGNAFADARAGGKSLFGPTGGGGGGMVGSDNVSYSADAGGGVGYQAQGGGAAAGTSGTTGTAGTAGTLLDSGSGGGGGGGGASTAATGAVGGAGSVQGGGGGGGGGGTSTGGAGGAGGNGQINVSGVA
jgi:hypothetical protein